MNALKNTTFSKYKLIGKDDGKIGVEMKGKRSIKGSDGCMGELGLGSAEWGIVE
jgi:hypothetical protein